MHSLLKRAEKGDNYLDTSSDNESRNITFDTKTMESEQTELETLKTEINTLAKETQDFRSEVEHTLCFSILCTYSLTAFK
jgi:uncharacterized protein YlxW (UPF0749 family)